jgi:hypothetical protein
LDWTGILAANVSTRPGIKRQEPSRQYHVWLQAGQLRVVIVGMLVPMLAHIPRGEFEQGYETGVFLPLVFTN